MKTSSDHGESGSKSKVSSPLRMLSALPMSKQNKNQNKPKHDNKELSKISNHNQKWVSKIWTCSGVILLWTMEHMKSIEGTDTLEYSNFKGLFLVADTIHFPCPFSSKHICWQSTFGLEKVLLGGCRFCTEDFCLKWTAIETTNPFL